MVQAKWNWHALRPTFGRFWWETLGKPLSWLCLCFFQPARFREEFEHYRFARRFTLMFRLAIPILLLSLLFALPVHVLLAACLQSCASFQLSSLTGTMPGSVLLATLLGVACGLVVGMLGEIGFGIMLALALGITGIAIGDIEMGFEKGVAVAVALGLIAGTGRGFQWGMLRGVLASVLGGLSWAITSLFTQAIVPGSIVTGITGGIAITLVLLVSYTLGYYRILLYLVSGPSGLWAYIASRKNAPEVFSYLRRSALYWDECIFLPLPYLQQTLLIAVGQDLQRALKELTFIIDKRPQQQQTALAVLCEIALRDMEARETIRDIADATQRLGEILPQRIMLAEPRLLTPFSHLADASREAARYGGPLNWQTRRTALKDMIAALEKIFPDTAFPDTPRLSALLKQVVKNWRSAALQQQEKLEQGLEGIGQIMNPYNPGHTTTSDTPFVGRTDIVRQLSEALSKPHRPTFLLNGERRMGKSTMLRQLPNLLGASYIPIFYDLQNPGVSSSIDVFLAKLAEQIYNEISLRGMRIEKLERTRLQEALRRNEAAIYYPFDEWLDALERTLEQEKRTVILLFDEFEKLEEAGAAQYIALNLLLDWLRNTIQNRTHIALLFSGVRTFGEMGANWASYFVNARTLKVSFLHPAEARHLITQPMPNFSLEELFSKEVVEEIMRVTGCHPFLVQAACSELIDNLNLENRQRAELEDVATAVTYVLKNWWDTYFRDLWERTDPQQRMCLQLLNQQAGSDISSLTQQNGLDEHTTREALQTLLKRDLVVLSENSYQIAAPIFCRWVERNI